MHYIDNTVPKSYFVWVAIAINYVIKYLVNDEKQKCFDCWYLDQGTTMKNNTLQKEIEIKKSNNLSSLNLEWSLRD